ncbi:MAG: GW dipeptide domain-containing protein [Saprospiraceae bacterium]|nr:GW dipeptide domain-containing protein [Saprospiraceae bacterium]
MKEMNIKSFLPAIIFALFLGGCGNDPKVIQPTSSNDSGSAEQPSMSEPEKSDVHEVVVQEVLHTDKYTYLRVDEDGRQYWIAVGKIDAEKGSKYFYTGGLLKRNFYSREFDRNFDEIYLVSRITPADPTSGGSALNKAMSKMNQPEFELVEVETAPGTVSLDELFANPGNYEGKEVKVKGQVVKVNNQIMNRNWVHLQDGSKSSEERLDLTVTTQEVIPVGAIVTMEGIIKTNQDFGAGYRYDIIMEEASVLQ